MTAKVTAADDVDDGEASEDDASEDDGRGMSAEVVRRADITRREGEPGNGRCGPGEG